MHRRQRTTAISDDDPPSGKCDGAGRGKLFRSPAEDLTRPDDDRRNRSLHGLSRTLLANLVTGVSEGYVRKMEIFGVGYRVALKGSDLEFALGYSHPVLIKAPEGITFAVETPTKFSITGIDKQKVGQIAANIRRLRRPDPYKGKGVRYEGEQVRRKVGKTGK